jgi:hypothetical protein
MEKVLGTWRQLRQANPAAGSLLEFRDGGFFQHLDEWRRNGKDALGVDGGHARRAPAIHEQKEICLFDNGVDFVPEVPGVLAPIFCPYNLDQHVVGLREPVQGRGAIGSPTDLNLVQGPEFVGHVWRHAQPRRIIECGAGRDMPPLPQKEVGVFFDDVSIA